MILPYHLPSISRDDTDKYMYSPMLSPPPSIDHSTGQAITPPPEKSFLQKYWLPILGIAIFAMAQMGPDQPQDKAK